MTDTGAATLIFMRFCGWSAGSHQRTLFIHHASVCNFSVWDQLFFFVALAHSLDTLNTSVCDSAHFPTRSCQPNVSPPDYRLSLVEKSSMPWCAIFLCSQCWSHSANFLHQERHCGAAGTDQVSTRAAALCPALWFLDSHSRPSAPSTSHGPATNPSLLTSNLCKLALVHMIMYCRVGSSPRRSCSASSKSPEGLLLCPKAAIGQSNRQVSQHDCAGSSSGCC